MTTTTRTPLERRFQQRGIALIELARGLTTPVRFTDPVVEHLATRRAAGLFDFSFMACAGIEGRDSLAFLHGLQTRNLAGLPDNRLAYTLLLREDGTVLDDATVWRLAADRYLLFVGRRDDLQHVARHASDYGVSISDRSREYAVIAVQGRHAWMAICCCFAGDPPPSLPYYGFAETAFRGGPCLVARIGYGGETGYELVIAAEAAPELWEDLVRAGANLGLAECGFEAIDSLRIEAGHILFLRELAMPVTPYQIGLSRLLDFYRGPFIGMDALRRMRWQAPRQCLVGLLIDEADTLAPYVTACILPGTARLTSSCVSPIFGRRIGLGFVTAADRHPGTRVEVAAGVSARVARLPFYDPAKFLPRRTR